MEMLSPLLIEILAAGGSAEITVSGISMYPMLRDGISQVRLTAAADLHVGDLPLYRRENGAYVLHRIVGRDGEKFICCGDNQWHIETGVERTQIVAVVTDFKRTERWRSCDSRVYRLYVWLWIRLRPLRRLLLGGTRRAGQTVAWLFKRKK